MTIYTLLGGALLLTLAHLFPFIFASAARVLAGEPPVLTNKKFAQLAAVTFAVWLAVLLALWFWKNA